MIARRAFSTQALALSLLLSASPLLAGGVDNRNNNSADYIRSLSRNATVSGSDAAIYNPAGTTRLAPGLHVSVHNQSLDKFNEQVLPGAYGTFEQGLMSPLYPTGFMAYRKDAWSAFGGFSFAGGGGELEYEKGSATVYLLQTNLSAMNPPQDADAYLRSIYPAATVGGAYAFGDKVSMALGVRWLYARTDVTVDGDRSFAPKNTSKIVDHMEEARGFTGIASVDWFPAPDFVLALRIEGPTPLEFEVQRSVLNLDEVLKDAAARTRFTTTLRQSLRDEGEKFHRDLPANIGLGAAWSGLPHLRAETSLNWYFQTLADWEGKENLHDDSWELSLGLEYQTPLPLLLSAGAMYTESGAGPTSYQLENPALDSYTLGLGGRYLFGGRMAVIAGFAANLAFDDKVTLALPPVKAELHKRVLVYAVGFEYGAF